MDRQYWIDRQSAAMALARSARTSESRLFHYELAGRYSVRAAYAVNAELASPGSGVLRLPVLPEPDLHGDRRLDSNDNQSRRD